jgi:hypothetical protein
MILLEPPRKLMWLWIHCSQIYFWFGNLNNFGYFSLVWQWRTSLWICRGLQSQICRFKISNYIPLQIVVKKFRIWNTRSDSVAPYRTQGKSSNIPCSLFILYFFLQWDTSLQLCSCLKNQICRFKIKIVDSKSKITSPCKTLVKWFRIWNCRSDSVAPYRVQGKSSSDGDMFSISEFLSWLSLSWSKWDTINQVKLVWISTNEMKI